MHNFVGTPALLLVFFTSLAPLLSSSPSPLSGTPSTYHSLLPPLSEPPPQHEPAQSPPSSSRPPPPPPNSPSSPPPPSCQPPLPLHFPQCPPSPSVAPPSSRPPPPQLLSSPPQHSPSPPPPPPPYNGTCPADALKMGACVDMLAGLVHVGIGPEVKAFCCPLFIGLVGIDAAACLCTIMTARLLDLKLLLPLALQLLIYCGNAPPPGYRCPIPP